MSKARWQPEKVDGFAAEFRVLARRYHTIKAEPAQIAKTLEKLAEVMREANALADEVDELKAKLDMAGSPKFAPFAPRAKAR